MVLDQLDDDDDDGDDGDVVGNDNDYSNESYDDNLWILNKPEYFGLNLQAHFNLFSKFLQFTFKMTSNIFHQLKHFVCTT